MRSYPKPRARATKWGYQLARVTFIGIKLYFIRINKMHSSSTKIK